MASKTERKRVTVTLAFIFIAVATLSLYAPAELTRYILTYGYQFGLPLYPLKLELALIWSGYVIWWSMLFYLLARASRS